jgi:hypothetical protein
MAFGRYELAPGGAASPLPDAVPKKWITPVVRDMFWRVNGTSAPIASHPIKV